MKYTMLTAAVAALALAACGGGDTADAPAETETPTTEAPVTDTASSDNDAAPPAAKAEDATNVSAVPAMSADDLAPSAALAAILDAQPDEAKSRYQYRNPGETLTFFGVEPGMTVVEVLPGGGWYSKILIPLLGDEGTLIGADYSYEMWSKFGGFATEEFLEGKEIWAEQWVEDASEWLGDNETNLAAFAFENREGDLEGTADIAIMVRAFHHLNRFNDDDINHMTEALSDLSAVLNDDGMLGIVQHRGPEGNDDAWANGDNGYLKQSDVIAWVEGAGFELVATTEINANPSDVPTNDEVVWRLPPTLGTSNDNEELRADMQAIGESDRMTLLFRKK